jgi:hypothetical protein
MTNIIQLVQDRFENAEIFNNDENNAIIPVNFNINPTSKILFVVGSNASGKSVIGKIVEYVSEEANATKRSCSMRNRTSGSFGQRLIFGDEADSSTGMNSVSSAIKGIQATVEETNSVLILDEPDLGLADEYSSALGQYIAQQINEHHEQLGLIVVITHSRKLVNYAMKELVVPYSSVFVGDANKTFEQWLDESFQPASIEDLLGLKAKNRETWKRIEQLNRSD